MVRLLNRQLILPLLSLTLYLPSISTTPLNPLHQPTLQTHTQNLTIPPTPPPHPTCVTSFRWLPTTIHAPDCTSALTLLKRAESQKSFSQPFEFLAPYTPHSTTHLLTLGTPRVYSKRTCTIAVFMLKSWPHDQFPPWGTGEWFPPNDVATLGEVLDGAKAVVEGCRTRDRGAQMAGWTRRGQFRDGIAVGVLETGGIVDLMIRGWVREGGGGVIWDKR